MAKNTSTYTAQKITVTLPTLLLERMAEYIPSRRRSQFIVEAIEERLALEEQVAALDESAGAWSDEDYPDLDSVEAVETWIRELRSTWTIADTTLETTVETARHE